MPEYGVDELVRQWTEERSMDEELLEANQIKSMWLAEAPVTARKASIPTQRGNADRALFNADSADPAFVAAMRKRLPDIPHELLVGAAACWQMAGTVAEAEQWWEAGISPLDQRVMHYRVAGLAPSDLSRRLGPLTVLEHLRRGSAPAWCVARLNRQR